MENHLNIVLVGMPSAGKTTIGKQIAETLDRPFYDVDDEIVKDAQMSVSEIFEKFGEEHFRKLESDTIFRLSKETSIVISTGGGAIKNKMNIDQLKKQGIVYFIDRDLENLVSDDPTRPLSSSKEAVEILYKERLPLYTAYADVKIDNNETIEDCVDSLLYSYRTYLNKD